MRSPFKFLDAYTVADKAVFFGRDAEKEALYDLVFRTPLILVYGLSGTGKTSLIQCGLAGNFDGPEWFPFYVRRQNDINISLRHALRAELEDPPPNAGLPELVGELFAEYLSPVYLIFDQFEELFILGSPEEQQQFAEDIRQLLAAELNCKVILVVREEYLGRLYPLEKAIPFLFDYRLRVEPMNNNRVSEVIRSSFRQFHIQLELPAEDRIQEIIDNISGGRSGIPLPYLQIYLDHLWRAGQRQEEKNGADHPPIYLSSTDIQGLGRIEGVLEKFLRQQREELQAELEGRYAGLPEDAVTRIIDAFVTAEGTKRPVRFRREADTRLIRLEPDVRQLLPSLNRGALTDCLEALEQRRLLRFMDDTIELAHDSLATLIDEQRTDAQRRLNEVKNRVAANYREWQRTGEFLTRRQLLSLEPYLPKVQLDDHLRRFITDSYAHVEAVEAAERERELSERELERERELRGTAEKSARMARRRLRLVALFAILALALALVAGWQSNEIRDANEVAQANLLQANKSKREADSLRQVAIDSAQVAQAQRDTAEYQRTLAEEQRKIAQAQRDSVRRAQLRYLLSQAELKSAKNDFESAITDYQSAMKLVADDSVKLQIQRSLARCYAEREELAFRENKEKGLALQAAGECLAALRYLEKAKASEENIKEAEAALRETGRNLQATGDNQAALFYLEKAQSLQNDREAVAAALTGCRRQLE